VPTSTAPARHWRFAPVLLILAAGAGFWLSGLWRALTLDSLPMHYAELLAMVRAHPYTSYVAFVAAAAVATAACLPTTFLTMVAGGVLFGGWVGAGGAVASSTLGAAATYLAVRLAGDGRIRQWVERDDSPFNRFVCHIDADPFVCILAMRLAPMIPFPAVSIAAGAVHAPFKAYFPATLLGVAPAALLLGHLGAGVSGLFASGAPFEAELLWRPDIIGPLTVVALAGAGAAVIAIRRRART